MAELLPPLAAPLGSIAARLIDLLPVVKNHVYHPDFGGSFSLKRVLPALVPELSYNTLPIADGATASLELERLLFEGHELEAPARARLRSDLLRYCHQDTWGLVEMLDRFRRLAGAAGQGSTLP
jgi:predicted RecB family nuclease